MRPMGQWTAADAATSARANCEKRAKKTTCLVNSFFFFYPITRGFNRECSFLTTGPIPENAFNVSGETGIRQLLQLDPTQVGCVRPCIATASGERVILRCCLRRKGMTTSEQLACYKLVVRFLGRRDNLARQN